MHKRYLIATATLLALLTPTARAAADGSDNGGRDGGAFTNDNGVGASAGSGGATGTGGGQGSGGVSPCTYSTLPPDQQAVANDLAKTGLLTKGPDPGSWVRQICLDANGKSTSVVIWVQTPPAVPVNLGALAQQAAQFTVIPVPGIALNPTRDRGEVVNFPTWMWLTSCAPVRAQASAGPVTVTATATPQLTIFDMGDGHQVTCTGPGTAYDPSQSPGTQLSNCTYSYPASSANQPGQVYVITATTTWHVTWTAVGIAGGGDLGLITRSASVPVRVTEIQALNDSPTTGG